MRINLLRDFEIKQEQKTIVRNIRCLFLPICEQQASMTQAHWAMANMESLWATKSELIYSMTTPALSARQTTVRYSHSRALSTYWRWHGFGCVHAWKSSWCHREAQISWRRSGPDDVPSVLLKKIADCIVGPLMSLNLLVIHQLVKYRATGRMPAHRSIDPLINIDQ